MQYASFEHFVSAHDAMKAQYRCKLSNLFLDSPNLRDLMAQKNCFLHTTEGILFLLVPKHGAYHDCLYMARDTDALKAGLAEMLRLYNEALPIRLSIIGKDPLAGELSALCQGEGFRLGKKLLRMRIKWPEAKRLEPMRPYAEEYRDRISFAEADEAQEILDILQENFDLMADNLPELAEIRENIAKRQVVVLRADNKIASLHYFSLQNNTIHLLYDVTRKEYRGGNGFFIALAVFVYDHLKAQGREHMLYFIGWRDAANQKLLKHAKKSNQLPDGIVIYNMQWTPADQNRFPKESRP